MGQDELQRLQELRNDLWWPLSHSLARVGAVYTGGASGLVFFAASRDPVPLENFVRSVHGLEDGVEDPVLAGGLVAGSCFAVLNAEEAEFPAPQGGKELLAQFQNEHYELAPLHKRMLPRRDDADVDLEEEVPEPEPEESEKEEEKEEQEEENEEKEEREEKEENDEKEKTNEGNEDADERERGEEDLSAE